MRAREDNAGDSAPLEGEDAMNSKRRAKKVTLSGTVCYAQCDEDPALETAIVTDYGDELFVEPIGEMREPAAWLDAYVEVSGHVYRNGSVNVIRVNRIREIVDDTEFGDAEHDLDVFDIEPLPDDDEGEYGDFS